MWIFDSYYKGCVKLWCRERGLARISAAYPPSFCMHLTDPHAHFEMIEGLESRYRVEECSFNTIFGSFQGHRIYASRKVAEKIERQTRYAAELYNVDVKECSTLLASARHRRRTPFQIAVRPVPVGSNETANKRSIEHPAIGFLTRIFFVRFEECFFYRSFENRLIRKYQYCVALFP